MTPAPSRLSRFVPLAAVVTCIVGASLAWSAAPASLQRAGRGAAEQTVAMPNAADSLKFAVLGDFGTGGKPQYEMAAQMAKVHERFPFELVVTVGDNLYGGERPQDFKKKFEIPYK